MNKTDKYIRCKRCHRILRTPEAQARGYGKCCYNYFLAECKKEQYNLFDMKAVKK